MSKEFVNQKVNDAASFLGRLVAEFKYNEITIEELAQQSYIRGIEDAFETLHQGVKGENS